jgi:CRISP-associated protein Cas1
MSTRGDTLDLPEAIRRVPVSDRVTGIFLERGRLDADAHCLRFSNADMDVPIPVGIAAVVFLEPGTTVTHRAVQLAAVNGTLLTWVGEACGKVYAVGSAFSGSVENLLRQANVAIDPSRRLRAAKRVFEMMFREACPEARTIEAVRGHEGARVRTIYDQLAKSHGLSWAGRQTGEAIDSINAAISTANSFLYGVVEAVILATGHSPAIGIVHTGDPRSFVFDIADTVKFETVVPLASLTSCCCRIHSCNRITLRSYHPWQTSASRCG